MDTNGESLEGLSDDRDFKKKVINQLLKDRERIESLINENEKLRKTIRNKDERIKWLNNRSNVYRDQLESQSASLDAYKKKVDELEGKLTLARADYINLMKIRYE